MGPLEMRLDQLQPSQLFICAEKLAAVERALDEVDGELKEPLPVKRLDGRTVLTDGHTRALAVLRAGAKTVSVSWEPDDLDWGAYRICVAWCLQAGVRAVGDLRTRVVPVQEYETLWLDRCRHMQEGLTRGRMPDDKA